MKIIETTLRDIPTARIGEKAEELDVDIYVDYDVVVHVNGSPVLAYGDLDNINYSEIVAWARRTSFPKVRRMAYVQGKEWSVKQTKELYFGNTMARQVYNVPPGLTRTTRDNIGIYRTQIIPLVRALEQKFKVNMPDQYRKQQNEVEKILDEWRIDGGLYTQAVVNDSNVFSYHVDSMNLPGSWNAMAAFAANTVGGNTIVPALNMRFAMHGAKFLIFNAQHIIHAVTPLTHVTKDAYRYSFVFYAHEHMTKMGTTKQEMDKFKASLDKRFDKSYRDERQKLIQASRRKAQKSGHN
jgi:hypothetical protein